MDMYKKKQKLDVMYSQNQCILVILFKRTDT